MILDEALPRNTATTLDDLFRIAGVRHPHAVALVDPANREAFTDGAPRTLTFAQADRAISALATRLRRLGLPTDTVIAMQLANTVESVVTLLGILRAGMIPAPVPLLWRQQEMIEALGRVGAKVIISSARLGSCVQTDVAMQVAAELFPIRYVCAFGGDWQDGIVPLDDVFADGEPEFLPPEPRREHPGAHLAVVTFEAGPDGFIPVARSHAQVIAGGRALHAACARGEDAPILSTIPVASFGGLAVTLVPWLMSGGALHLHHGFDLDVFSTQCRAMTGGTIVVPAQVAGALADQPSHDASNAVIALWRAPERLVSGAPWKSKAPVVDIACFGEIGLACIQRTEGQPPSIPLGLIDEIEPKRTKLNTLALRGSMVPVKPYPPGAELGGMPHLTADEAGHVDTGFLCLLDRVTRSLVVSGPPAGFTTVGGYRFRHHDLENLVAATDPEATLIAVPDAVLGQRLAGSSAEQQRLEADLATKGVNPLVAAAFRRRGADAA